MGVAIRLRGFLWSLYNAGTAPQSVQEPAQLMLRSEGVAPAFLGKIPRPVGFSEELPRLVIPVCFRCFVPCFRQKITRRPSQVCDPSPFRVFVGPFSA